MSLLGFKLYFLCVNTVKPTRIKKGFVFDILDIYLSPKGRT
jgi:hypothetical protein